MAHDRICIESISSAGGADQLAGGLDDIFFAASSVQHFADDDARCRFRERWLGRYLRDDARHGFVALDASRRVIGSLISPTSGTSLPSQPAIRRTCTSILPRRGAAVAWAGN